jgi:hypothetical protein
MYIIDIPSSGREKVLAALQRPFPALTSLRFVFLSQKENVPVFPASFLGGSAPALQTLCLNSIPFPGLPKLLLTATHLLTLVFGRFLIPGIFHRKRWSPPFPC